MSRKWVIQQIVSLETDGADLSDDRIRADDPKLYRAACEHFSSWETALEYAGIGHGDRIVADLFPSGIDAKIRKMCVTGCSLNADRARDRDEQLYTAAVELHGSWIAALRSLGINVERIGPYHKRPEAKQILAQIRARHAAGLSIRHGDVCFDDSALVRSAKSRYGSWRAALEAAGVVD